VTAAASVRLRVTVTDVWDTVTLPAPPAMTIGEVKSRALVEATGRSLDPAAYVVKHRGAPVLDENRTVSDLGLGDGTPLIVLPARRLPAR
jgi:hypothetical protein